MSKTILIGLAGLIGTLLRYWLSGVVARQSGVVWIRHGLAKTLVT